MAGLPWFTACADFPDHPKTVRLCRAIGESNAGMYVIRLWAFCAAYQQDGMFVGEDAGAMLEHATGWAGEPGKLLQALIRCGNSGAGYVEARDGGYYVHEWVERNGAHLAKRERDAARLREQRTLKRQSRDCSATVARPSHDSRALEGEGERELLEASRDEAPPRAKREQSDPRKAEKRAVFERVFRETRNAEYRWQGPKDANAVKALVAVPIEEWEARARLGLVATEWAKRISSVAQLAMKWNDLVPGNSQPKGYSAVGRVGDFSKPEENEW